MTRSVFISGRGAVCGLGSGVGTVADRVFDGATALRPRARTAVFRAPTAVAGEFAADLFPEVAEVDLPSAAAIRAGEQALAEAGQPPRQPIGLVLATTKAELSGLGTEPHDDPGYGQPARLARRVADGLGMTRVLASVSTACTSGISALALAARRIAAGEVERVLVIGTDALNEFILAGFGGMHILDPKPCRPFDVSRRGISVGDGAAAMLVTRHESESVGVRIAGHGGANDAIHVTGCDRTGGGLALAVRRALAHAGVARDDIDVVHLHGTATKANDASEALALGTVYEGPTPPAFGTKAQTGHTFGAAGMLESLIAIAALERGEVPANVGLVEPGVDPRLDLARERATLARARRALKVSSGFGGVQQAMVFER